MKQLGKTALLLQTEGKSVDPTKHHDSLLLFVTSNPNIATALGMPAEYVYTGGCNELRLRLPKKHPNSSVQVLISMVTGVVLGLALRLLAPAFSVSLSNPVISPVLYTIANLLRLIAGPLIFLSIVAGITGVGDAASFGKMGRLMVTLFLVITLY